MGGARCNDGDTVSESVDVGGDEPVGGGGVAQLSDPVKPPAFDSTRGEERTCVVVAGCDGDDTVGESGDVGGDGFVDDGVVAELSPPVVSPAFDCAGGEQRARVILAGCDGGDTVGESGDVGGYESVGGGVVADLSVAVVSPATDCAGGDDEACVVPSCADRSLL